MYSLIPYIWRPKLMRLLAERAAMYRVIDAGYFGRELHYAEVLLESGA